MHCEEVTNTLIDFAEGTLEPAQKAAIDDHLQTCEACSSEYDFVYRWRMQANAWHDEPVPRWQPPRVLSNRYWSSPFLQWFPLAASAAALTLAVVLFFDTRDDPTGAMPASGVAQNSQFPTLQRASTSELDSRFAQFTRDWEARQSINQSLMVQSVLEANRTQRALELEALVRVLKAEMDRQALDTQESLRYVINHQVEDQQRLEQLSDFVQHTSFNSEERPSL